MERARILVVGHELMLLSTRVSILTRLGMHATAAGSAEDALSHLAQHYYDVLFLCHTVDEYTARNLLNQVNFLYPSIKIARLHIEPVSENMLPVVGADVRMDYRPTSWLGVLDALLVDAA